MSFVRTLAALSAVAVLSMNSAFAGAIVGSQGFSASRVTITSPAGNDLATATAFSLRNFQLNDGVTGAFDDGTGAAVSSVIWPTLTFNTTDGTSLYFSDVKFGTFQSTSIVKDSFGMYYATGTFAPGTDYPGLTSNTAEIDFAFSQVGGAGHTVSGSATLITPSVHNVPEPSSLALAFVGGLMGLVAVRRNRK